MKRHIITLAAVLSAGIIAGCGGGGSTPATSAISGSVADGYLAGATVFLDKNGNYRLDAGEPSTMTDANGAYTLNIDPADMGRYPLVAVAITGQTIDKDTNSYVTGSYVLSMPGEAVSGMMGRNFISPMSTMIREKMAANPGMTMNDAVTQLRNQMNLSPGIDMMADFMAGSQSGSSAAGYQTMHAIARQMAGVMSAEALLVMNGSAVNLNRYKGMMATINSNMPAIAADALNDPGMNSTFMTGMMTSMQTQLGAISTTGFTNYSAMFRNMTGHSSFWSSTGTPMSPLGGGMMN